ncbi:polymeric immunoglobulin receptor-like isoform X1 [Seriola dumerili]|uniref:polymeric immunoglobulin receptor-like isoform X1 n=1 Tax=Seriola dumerili TaxID=41447 RepID=UPI000BBF3A62|nr:polymeric immunoglobulin receptor-like isoform X1 [Seriola dumerili]
MWILRNLLFILCIALSCVSGAVPVIHVSGYEGRDVNVSCPYGEGYESHEKYLCRNDCGNGDVLIMTTQANKNKYSISDDKSKRVLTTTISDLSSVDAGKYWCGVTRSGLDYYPAEVRLDVVPDSCCDQFTEVHSHEEGSVSILCPYDSKYQKNLKYICRGRQPSICLQQAVVTSNRKLNGKFTLTGDEESGKFTVNITSLTQKDSGWFLCGVERNNGLDVFSAVKLEVKVSPQTTSTAISIITTEPVTSQSTYISTNPVEDAAHFSILVYILPAVLVGLLLILTFFLARVCKDKCNKVHGVRVIMSINRSNEEIIVDNIIYNMEEDADMGSIRPQSVLHHDDNPGEDQQTVYQNFTKPEDVWHNHTDTSCDS